MNTDAAEAIAMKIREVWGGNGPTISAWVAELRDLDEMVARSALNRLKLTENYCPSIAKFHAAYGEQAKTVTDQQPPCIACDGAGWVEATPIVTEYRTTSQVSRCVVCGGSGKARTMAGAA